MALAAVYLSTLAPGLTWANDGSDGADLITAAATGGVAHPGGYPLYLLLARLFQLLPCGSLAYRTNLFSGLAMALAAVVAVDIVIRSISSRRSTFRTFAGLSTGFAFGLAPLVWSQAVITEVYALQALLTALILHLYAIPRQESYQLQIGRGLLLGLAVSNHLTGLLLIPIALLLGSLKGQENDDSPEQLELRDLTFHPASLRRQMIGLAVGLAIYLLLPLRALAQPSVNWGAVTTFERFWWLVSGELFRSYYLGLTLPGFWVRIQAYAGLLVRQFGLAGIALGLVGLIVFGGRSRLTVLTLWLTTASSVFAIVYHPADSYLYLIPVILCFSIWLGQGTGGLMQFIAARSAWLALSLGAMVLGFFTIHSLSVLLNVEATHDHRAEAFGREVLSAAPQDAILFAKGDQAVFTLWYFHFALHERPDLAIIAEDLLHFDWYQENLQSVYQGLIIPGPFPWPETIVQANSQRPVCTVSYSDRVEMECRSALSTR